MTCFVTKKDVLVFASTSFLQRCTALSSKDDKAFFVQKKALY